MTLRKYVVTEDVDLTVPVRREVAKVVREPVDGNASHGGPIADGDSSETIVLREEEIIVDKEVVAKERVAVETDVETEQKHVTDTVRKERVSIDGDVNTPNR